MVELPKIKSNALKNLVRKVSDVSSKEKEESINEALIYNAPEGTNQPRRWIWKEFLVGFTLCGLFCYGVMTNSKDIQPTDSTVKANSTIQILNCVSFFIMIVFGSPLV